MKLKFKFKEPDLIDSAIGIALFLGIFYVMVAYIILPFFNLSYNVTVTGLSPGITQGLLLITLVVGIIAAVKLLLRTRKF